MAATKARLGTDRASPSPYLASEDSDAESVSSKRRSEYHVPHHIPSSPRITSRGDSAAEHVCLKLTAELNGKRAASPQKPAFKKKLQGHTSGSAPPRMPSKLGRPPKNRADVAKAHSASPFRKGSSASPKPDQPPKSASPEKAAAGKPGSKPGSVKSSLGKPESAKARSKSPAPPPAPSAPPPAPPADESSEGEDDY